VLKLDEDLPGLLIDSPSRRRRLKLASAFGKFSRLESVRDPYLPGNQLAGRQPMLISGQPKLEIALVFAGRCPSPKFF